MYSVEFIVNVIIGWTILHVLIALLLIYGKKLFQEREQFFNEIKRHNNELGYENAQKSN